MAKSSITNITTTQTFQNWFDKTNEIVDIFRDEAMTASPGGDTTTGNATLVGEFTATDVKATDAVQADLFQPYNSGQVMVFDGDIEIQNSDQTVATFKHIAAGPRVNFTDNTITWEMGFENSSAAFIINTGVGTTRFKLDTAGTLTVPNLATTEGITVGTDLEVTGDSRFDGVFDVNGEATFTDDVTITGTLDLDGGDLSIGALTTTGNITSAGDITGVNIQATGDVITSYSASDIKLKENLEIIPDALEKVSKINGYTFNYKKNPDERVTGVVAQELEEILPGIVFDASDETGNYKAVRYGNIVALLIQAVKELNEEVERLKNGNTD